MDQDLGIRSDTLNQIEEKLGPNLQHFGLGPDILNKIIVQEIKARINK